MICEADGKILMLREMNLNLRVLEDESLSLCDLGLPYGSFIFYHVQFFEDIVVYVTTGTPKQLFIVDCAAKRIIGKYVPHADSNIVEVDHESLYISLKLILAPALNQTHAHTPMISDMLNILTKSHSDRTHTDIHSHGGKWEGLAASFFILRC